MSAYHRRLFLFLSVATFFEGFDIYALSQILPNVCRDLGLRPDQEGLLVSVISLGAVLAYFLIRQADRWGRRPILSATLAGYTLSSLLTGIMPNAVGFALCQLLARVFLYGEYGVAAIYAAEEFPADVRGRFIGMLQVFSVIGGVVCAGCIPGLLKTPFGWRSVFFIGAIPLALIVIARRNLRETTRFTEQAQRGLPAPSLFRIIRSPYRGRMLLLALIWALTLIGTSNASMFWKEYAQSELHFSDAAVGTCIAVAAVSGIPVLFFCGRLIDKLGRRRSALLVYAGMIAGIFIAFSASAKPILILALLAIFGIGGLIQPLLSAFTIELFPTELRGDAYAWSSNLLGRLGLVVSPYVIGLCAAQLGWGTTLRATVLGPLLALALIWITMPETSCRELEATSMLPPRS